MSDPGYKDASSPVPTPTGRSLGRLVVDAIVGSLLASAVVLVYALDDASPPDAAAPAEEPAVGALAEPAIPPEPPVLTLADLPAPAMETPVEPPPPPPVAAPPPPEPPPPPLPPADKPCIAAHFARGEFGVVTTTGNPDDPTDDLKQLTFGPAGETNNTRLKIDGKTPWLGTHEGQVVTAAGGTLEGESATFAWRYNDILVTRRVSLVRGPTSGRLDTLQVDFELENEGKRRHSVGMRVMIDSLIGGNDGVPFIVPGSEQIVTSPTSYKGKNVPDFVRALESENLVRPGVVCDLGLRPEAGDRPDEVVLTHWPGGDAAWDYARVFRLFPFGNDTAIGLYYHPKPLEPEAKRHIRFTYGLATLSSTQTKNAELSLTAGGPFLAGGKFWLVALVRNPKKGQTVSVELPKGLALENGHAASKDVPASTTYSQLSWLVAIAPDAGGPARLSARLDPDAVTERQDIEIKSREPSLTLSAPGSIVAGRPFWVTADVLNPRRGQTVQLALPEGLSLVESHQAAKRVDAPLGAAATRLTWLVQANAAMGAQRARLAGRLLPVGIEKTHEIAIEPAPTQLTAAANSPVSTGAAFWVSATVRNGKPGQRLTIQLPPGMTLDDAYPAVRPAQPLPAAAAAQSPVNASWLVRVAGDRAPGKTEVVVRLAPDGMEKTLSVTVEPRRSRLILRAPPTIRAGRPFWVAAAVANPRKGQTAVLEIPDLLELDAKHRPSVPVAADKPVTQINWLVTARTRAKGDVRIAVRIQPDGLAESLHVVTEGSIIEN